MGKKGKNIFFRQPSTRGFSCIFRLQSEPQKLWAAEFYEVFFFSVCQVSVCRHGNDYEDQDIHVFVCY